MNNDEHQQYIMKTFVMLITDLIIGATFMLLGLYYSKNIITSFGVVLCIIGILLFIAFNSKKDKEVEQWNKNKKTY